MGLIKEPIDVDFTVQPKVWTTEEEREFSELIREQKKAYNTSKSAVSAKRTPTPLRRKKVLA
ncbi:MAG: hypothetical protein FWD02_00270 [Bacteroidales bacterium]|nr:hypothetical protein [Bacteroidales bacterium]